jgi:hypothetical protein
MPGYIELASAVAQIINKRVPGRREAAQLEYRQLLELLGQALGSNEDTLAAQIRKRLKEIRRVYQDIE